MPLIAATGVGGGGGGTTANINTLAANFIVACVSVDSSTGTVPTPTDSEFNTWTPLTQVGGANPPFFRSRLFYIENPSCDAAHNFTISGTNASIAVAAFSGMLTSGVFDLEASGGGAASNGVESAQGGSVTPSVADSLVISGNGIEAVRTLAIGSGFTIAIEIPHVGGVSYGSALAYKELTAIGADNPVWDWNGQGNTNSVVLNAVFKAVVAAVGKKFLLLRC